MWPAFALLVVVILLVLLRACGLALPGYGSWHRIGWAFCSPRASVSESERGQERGRALAEQALQLQLRIARKEMACLAAPPAPSPRRAERPRCPPIQPARLMLIFDTSGSMRLPLDADPVDMEELERRWSEGDQQAARRARSLQEAPGRKRLDAAREAALALVGKLPPGLETGLVSFEGCRLRTDVPPTVDKGAVSGALGRLPFDGGTPIAMALRAMQTAMADGAGGPDGGRGRSVVLITDGQEGCRGDPCAEARELHRQLPELRVHVIDIVGRSRLQCVAEATRGTIATATDIAALEAAIEKARAELDQPADCAR
ncbi:MAG: VWA domain-containing protein [Alphaproteobacteria bacterium]|nr:VWA domain-containing protein [Alphaproteobacteria bacterium]